MYIKNFEDLIFSDNDIREDALYIINSALIAADPYFETKKRIKLVKDNLVINSFSVDLTKRDHIYVLGGGKAAYPVAKALEEIFKNRITKGLIVLKDNNNKGSLERIEIKTASHSIPNEAGFEAAKKIKCLANEAKKNDLVFWINTGGISSLAPFPIEQITFEEKKYIHQLLLTSGANIKEINTVRSHLSQIKGGKLALSIFPAEIVNLIISDNPGDPINVGPTGLDHSTFSDAISILKNYNLWDKFPERAKEYLLTATPDLETPKSFGKYQSKIHSFILVNNRLACGGAITEAEKRGYNAILLSSCIEGESRDVARVHAAIGKEIFYSGNPIKRPACIVSGGETTVTVKGDGKGGRNLEFALTAAIEIERMQNIVILSLGTDGMDGQTDAAGAIVDGNTVPKARKKGVNPIDFLKRNDSYNFLKITNDLIITGHTGTNVMDIRIILTK